MKNLYNNYMLTAQLNKANVSKPLITSKNQNGFSLVELLIVIVIIGALFFFLIETIDIKSLMNKSKNSVIKSHMQKAALSVEAYNSSYGSYPDEEAYLSSLKSNNSEFEPHCTKLGYADYECLYSSTGIPLPTTCDLSYWRKDKNGDKQCYLRYYSGDILSFGQSSSSFRIYAMTFSSTDDMFVFDSKIGSVVRCPYTVNDFSDLSDCKEF